MNISKHRLIMTQLLLAIFKDKDLSSVLGFKGGTSLLLCHNLTRFSTDLDFNLLDATQTEAVYHRLRDIASRFGTIDDEAIKFYGPILVLSYEKGERMLKIEVSNRQYDNHYDYHNILGTEIRVMTLPDMFAHKLCALYERITPRDVYDVWFFLHHRTSINERIIQLRTGMSVSEFAQVCADKVHTMTNHTLMQGLGEVLEDQHSKNFVKNQLIDETITGLKLFALYPQIANQEPTYRWQLIDSNPEIISKCKEEQIDLSTLSEHQLHRLLVLHQSIVCFNNQGQSVALTL